MAEFIPVPVKEFPADLVGQIRAEQQALGDVTAYLLHLGTQFRNTFKMSRYVSHMAILVEPVDPFLGADPEFPHTVAFIKGAILGTRVVSSCVEPNEAFSQLDIDLGARAFTLRRVSDLEEARRIGTAVYDRGLKGFTSSGELLTPLLDEWEPSLIPSIDLRLHLQSGIGTPLALLAEVKRLNAQAEAEKQAAAGRQVIADALAEGIDWDAQLRGL